MPMDHSKMRAGEMGLACRVWLDALQRHVNDLHREGGIVLLEEVVPHIERAIFLDGEEYAGAAR